jgi:hypothetical protein
MSKLIFSTMAVAVIMSGCSSISPYGLFAASQLDPLETTPGNFNFAVSVPKAFRLHDGDAKLELAFLTDESATDQSVQVKVPLSLWANTDGPQQATPDETIYVLYLAPKAATQVSTWQNQVKALRAQDIKGKGSLGISMGGGCLIQPLSNGFPFATWLRTEPDMEYIQLTRSADLFKLLDTEELDQFRNWLMPC